MKGWTAMKLGMKLKGLESQLAEEKKKKSSLQNSARISSLEREISQVKKNIEDAEVD